MLSPRCQHRRQTRAEKFDNSALGGSGCRRPYANALRYDVVGLARTLVTKCRASDQRRKELRSIITEGNEGGGWGENSEPIALLQLLKDVDTRWSSTFLMIDRLLELNLVSITDL